MKKYLLAAVAALALGGAAYADDPLLSRLDPIAKGINDKAQECLADAPFMNPLTGAALIRDCYERAIKSGPIPDPPSCMEMAQTWAFEELIRRHNLPVKDRSYRGLFDWFQGHHGYDSEIDPLMGTYLAQCKDNPSSMVCSMSPRFCNGQKD